MDVSLTVDVGPAARCIRSTWAKAGKSRARLCAWLLPTTVNRCSPVASVSPTCHRSPRLGPYSLEYSQCRRQPEWSVDSVRRPMQANTLSDASRPSAPTLQRRGSASAVHDLFELVRQEPGFRSMDHTVAVRADQCEIVEFGFRGAGDVKRCAVVTFDVVTAAVAINALEIEPAYLARESRARQPKTTIIDHNGHTPSPAPSDPGAHAPTSRYQASPGG